MTILLKPIPLKKIWGGSKLSKQYNFSQKNIGEVWGISAHRSISNIILNGKYRGISLRDFYNNHREYFGGLKSKEFPLLLKIIDAKDNLSVQVHPDNKYALMNENSYGKEECWYIIESEKDAKIQIGHNFKNETDLLNSIKNNNLEKKLNFIDIKNGDFFYIKSGLVHSICKNTTLLEVSQSSDITYRIYDYDRLENGKPRKLHLDKSIKVIDFNHNVNYKKNYNNFFTFKIFEFKQKKKIKSHLFGDYVYIIDGEGYIDKDKIKKGDFMIITSRNDYTLTGNLKIALVRIVL